MDSGRVCPCARPRAGVGGLTRAGGPGPVLTPCHSSPRLPRAREVGGPRQAIRRTRARARLAASSLIQHRVSRWALDRPRTQDQGRATCWQAIRLWRRSPRSGPCRLWVMRFGSPTGRARRTRHARGQRRAPSASRIQVLTPTASSGLSYERRARFVPRRSSRAGRAAC
jgi:hypothetical protein